MDERLVIWVAILYTDGVMKRRQASFEESGGIDYYPFLQIGKEHPESRIWKKSVIIKVTNKYED